MLCYSNTILRTIWCIGARRLQKQRDMVHEKTQKKNKIWRTEKHIKKTRYGARKNAEKNIAHGKKTQNKKKRYGARKKRRNKHDIVHEKKKKHDLVHEEINETWHGCCMKMCKDVFFFWWKNVAIYWSFSLEKKQKNTRLKHHVEHDGFRYFSMPSRGWRKQRKNAALRQEKRTSWNCHVWCVTTRNCYSWAGWTGFVVQNFPTCSQTAVILWWKKVISSCTSWGVCLVRKPFTDCYRARKSLKLW